MNRLLARFPDHDPLPDGPCVWIRWEAEKVGGMYVCGDEDGEFARASTLDGILAYVAELCVGPGTVREGALWERA